MQRLNTLWKLASAASSVRDIAQDVRTYYFAASHATTFYLHAEQSDITVTRWQREAIEVTSKLQAPFGWQIITDQDEAGVYVVAHRRSIVGGLSSAKFDVYLPQDAYLMFNLTRCRLTMQQLDGTFSFDPPSTLDSD